MSLTRHVCHCLCPSVCLTVFPFSCLRCLCVICRFLSLPAHPPICLSASVSLSEAFICLAFRGIFFVCVRGCVHLREGLRLVNVQGGSAYPALLQRLCQGLLIHQASPRGIDQERTLTHLWCTNTNKSTQNNRDMSSYLQKKKRIRCVCFCVSVSLAN